MIPIIAALAAILAQPIQPESQPTMIWRRCIYVTQYSDPWNFERFCQTQRGDCDWTPFVYEFAGTGRNTPPKDFKIDLPKEWLIEKGCLS